MSDNTLPPERKHHRFSPSTLQFREACDCYESRTESHVRAIAGTLAHAVVESGQDDNRLSDEDASMAAECLDFVESRRQFFEGLRQHDVLDPNRPDHPIPLIIEIKEAYLPIDDCKFEDGSKCTTGGYADHGFVYKDYAEWIDWKFGAWPVAPAKDNVQGICYVLGIFRKFPGVKSVKFTFMQPQLGLKSEHVFNRSEIPVLYLRVQRIVMRARAAAIRVSDDNDFSSATPHVPVCNFCSNLGRCTKVLDIMGKLGTKFHPLGIPENITPTMTLSKENTGLALRLAQVVKVWADAFRSQTTNRVLEGRADLPEGFTLASASKRSLADKEKFKQVALKYLTEAEYLSTLDILFGAVEDVISSKAPRGSKKAAVEQFKDELDSAGATKKGDSFTYLKATPVKSTSNNDNKTQTSTSTS